MSPRTIETSEPIKNLSREEIDRIIAEREADGEDCREATDENGEPVLVCRKSFGAG